MRSSAPAATARLALAFALLAATAGAQAAVRRAPAASSTTDVIAPLVLCPERIQATCSGPSGAVVEFSVAAWDDQDPDPELTYEPPPGSVFPIGETVVTFTATDDAGNSSVCVFVVEVLDTAPLAIDCPEDVLVEATRPDGELVTFTVGATGSCSAPPSVSSVPQSGSRFPLGTTTVQCLASDVLGRSEACSFRIRVRDSLAPEIYAAPVELRVDRGEAGATVSFAPAVVDLCDPAPAVVCSPPSGSFFPLGTTTVTCAAVDASGNAAAQEFTVTVLAVVGAAAPSDTEPLPHVVPGVLPPGWYSGDTHEHIQYCDGSVHFTEEIVARMEEEDLDVANVLIWHRTSVPYSAFVCFLTGHPDVRSTPSRILQFGVETSGLDCSRWGHLIGLDIGAEEARIVRGTLAEGDCADMPGMGLGGDGSGTLNAPVAERFLSTPGAVCGYAHTFWSMGLHHSQGYDWSTLLLGTGFTTDARYLDPEQRLAVPNVFRVMGIVSPPNSTRAFMPLLGPMDAVLGNVQFFETVVLGSPQPFMALTPPVAWSSMFYKLQSAGVDVALSAGTDRACLSTGSGPEDYPRTYVRTDEAFSYGAWTEGLAAGRTSVSMGPKVYLRMTLDGQEVGGSLQLRSGAASARARVELRSLEPIQDCVEIVAGGVVIASRFVELTQPGELVVSLPNLALPESTWVAARLCSQRAHTGVVHVYVDGRPAIDPRVAEYWMLWCDVVAKTTRDYASMAFFDDQEDEALAHIALARRAFDTLRSAGGFDPAWGIERLGLSRAACRGPIVIGAASPARAGQELLVTCANAPPSCDGLLVVSSAPIGGQLDEGGRWKAGGGDPVLGRFPVRSNRGGYAEVVVPASAVVGPTLHARFFWSHGPDCPRAGCVAGAAASSDALRFAVQ